MPKFTDSKGNAWDIEINIGTTMRLKADGVQFHELAENKYGKFLAMEQDDQALAEIVWALIKPQAEGKVSRKEFDNALDGPALQGAWEAFSTAFINFTRSPEIRSSLNKVFERTRRLQEMAAQTIEEKFSRMEKIGQEKIAVLSAEMTDEKMAAMLEPLRSELRLYR